MERSNRYRFSWKILPLVLFIFLALVFFKLLSQDNYDPNYLPSALVGQPVPEFRLPFLLKEGIYNKNQLPKEPFLLNIWASWCFTCRVEHPLLNDLAQEGIVIVGLNYKDEKDAALAWIKARGNPYQSIIFDESGSLGLDLGVTGAPETYLVDSKGIIRFKQIGEVTRKDWDQIIKPLLDELDQS